MTVNAEYGYLTSDLTSYQAFSRAAGVVFGAELTVPCRGSREGGTVAARKQSEFHLLYSNGLDGLVRLASCQAADPSASF